MGDEDLEGRNEVGKRDRLVRLPLLVGLDVVEEDDEVLLLALEVDLGLSGGALDHCEGVVMDQCVCVERIERRVLRSCCLPLLRVECDDCWS